MAQSTTEGATETVESVHFSFLTDDEVRSSSVKKITNPVFVDNMGRPVPGGLYDPALGPHEGQGSCKSCGLPSRDCRGHSGHIDLILPVYNPLLFRTLRGLLEITCFFCHRFRMESYKVRMYTSQLQLIIKGDIVNARNLNASDSSLEEIDGPLSEVHGKACYPTSKRVEQHKWTSLQYKEAHSLLNKVMKEKCKACQNCGAKNPKITCPTFGWLQMHGLSISDMRANVIRGNSVDSSNLESSSGVTDEVPTAKAHKKKKEKLPPEFFRQKSFSGPLLPSEVKDLLMSLWENEAQLCSLIVDIQQESLYTCGKIRSCSMFFMEAVLVPPTRFRPLAKRPGGEVDHPQSILLNRVLQSSISLRDAHMNNSERSKIVLRWRELQQAVNVLFDSNKAMGQVDKGLIGISQLLERKDGILRQKMMGKRVNYACRSVISPDPYLAVNEIGIPPYFALRLTYPETVTAWNVNKLRHAIINGPEVHPGATHYMDKLGVVMLLPSKSSRISLSRKLPSSRGVVTHPGKSLDSEFEGKVVRRHLQDGDIVLVNRQPTLHKPSMMAHVVRVLKGEKTLRMHYANCSTYNADFDGDEMNVHFPQDEISRAEAFNIVNANEQYVVPTSGDPIRGLIQDHIISGVLLTKKDTFLNQDEYHQLLYGSCVSAAAAPGYFLDKFGQKVCTINSEDEIQPLLPAILKPIPLWTGKQVITAILNHITRGRQPFTVKKTGRIPSEYFGKTSGEVKLLIQKNEFVHGVIDKAQFGKYGLVHAVQELYGSNTAGLLLSVLSRLFTLFLQMHGFTCGVEDLLILQKSDVERKTKLESSEKIGEHVHSQFIGAKDGDIDPMELPMEVEKVIRTNGESAVTRLDRMMSSALNCLTSEVNNGLFPRGLSKPFPRNCLSLMTTTGAKGGLVNFTQISSLLGQQELEGKRVPRMVSGKTLPCFPPWDCASRAGGFISDRFLTGLRPQEYYFHCMAGREGLVDTAIKTSRSGYLQRCLVKSLECLKVCYDHTVRDADGSVVQFSYGEDGVDVHKTSFMTEFKTLAANHRTVRERLGGQIKDAHLSKSDSYFKELPDALERKADNFIGCLSKKKRDLLDLRKRKNFMKLMKLKYLSSLAQPGEPVGVLAAQSVGEPSTQMTLNTFHFAGRGEMNVTLGIPRLQEILMRGSEKIQTPVMTCPLWKGRTRDDAEFIAAKLKKVSVADIVESMEIHIVPFYVQEEQASTIFKLKMKLYPPELYPPYLNITLEDTENTLKNLFVRELEDAIQSHIVMLTKIRGITSAKDESRSSKETDDDELNSEPSQVGGNDNGGDDEDGYVSPEDEGGDAEKRKRQATDEMNYYEDDTENERSVIDDERYDSKLSAGFESEVDQIKAADDDDYTIAGEDQIFEAEDEASEVESIAKSKATKLKQKSEAKGKKVESIRVKKEADRAILVVASGTDFEVHFSFNNEPHILLAQIAEKVAKKVYVKNAGDIDQCSVIDYNGDPNTPALQTAGVNFPAFWELQDYLDINNIISNDIHAVLNTYGVEAARATIINEVKGVFGSYGISVNIRHLTLIADFMTMDGGYRPMSRFGMANNSTSPFCKISYETACKFLVAAALHGEVDRLESPSARVSLGLPVTMGTGCVDLMQNLQI